MSKIEARNRVISDTFEECKDFFIVVAGRGKFGIDFDDEPSDVLYGSGFRIMRGQGSFYCSFKLNWGSLSIDPCFLKNRLCLSLPLFAGGKLDIKNLRSDKAIGDTCDFFNFIFDSKFLYD